MKKLSRFVLCLTAIGALLLGSGAPAQAAYYNSYSTIASLPAPSVCSDCTATQAFAAGGTYLYSVKVNGSNSRAVIYRVNKATRGSSSAELMTNGTNGTKYNNWLGHANDMVGADIDGQHHLFIVTMTSTGAQLVKVRYSGATYYKVGSYSITLNGSAKGVSGISKISTTSTALNFFFKSGSRVYRGSLPLRANSGTIALSTGFDLKVSGALVNGSPVADLTTFANQGFFYDASKGVAYYPLTKENRSIVLVYRGVSAATSGTITSDPNLSLRITSSAYTAFEIEGVGISEGKLYFNTNRVSDGSTGMPGGQYDGFHVFDGYTAS